MSKAKLLTLIAALALAFPVAAAGTEDVKVSDPGKTASKGAPAPQKLTPEQEKKVEMTAKETRPTATPKVAKKTEADKAAVKADKAAKRKAPTKEEAEQAKKSTPGG